MEITKLKSISFNENSFRKLHEMQIEFADRITIIGGHNGIGKSTIIGLVANGSGIRSSQYKSYFDKPFQAQFHELFHLSLEFDYFEDRKIKPSVGLTYEIRGHVFEKICNVSGHNESDSDQKRLKIVPRTVNKELGAILQIGNDARIPIPTIYLGMSRMTPIGEHSKENIKKSSLRSISLEDSAYLRECFDAVITSQFADNNKIHSHDFVGSKKSSKVPDLNHDSLSISLGQDSLSSIVTALVSFKKIKRELGDKYSGGILVIDEIDAGFHPHAQIKLIKLLKKEARNLSLQIIATSHSLTVFKETLSLSEDHSKVKIVDNVVYLWNTIAPQIMENATYKKLKRDMLSIPYAEDDIVRNELKIYFEDDEGKYFFEKLIEDRLDKDGSFNGIFLNCISAKVGCETLFSLSEADDYFKTVIIIFDNDVLSRQTNRGKIDSIHTFLALPSDSVFDSNTKPENRVPEMILKNFLHRYYESYAAGKKEENVEKMWKDSLRKQYPANLVKEQFIDLPSDQKLVPRETNKLWFRKCRKYLDDMNIVRYWAEDNKKQVDDFFDDFRVAIRHLGNLD